MESVSHKGRLRVRLTCRQLSPSLKQRDLESRQKSPLYSVAGEQVAGTEKLVQLLVAGRRLQLAQAAGKPDHSFRPPIVTAAKELINSYVQLGAAQLLRHCDMRESLVWVLRRVLICSRSIQHSRGWAPAHRLLCRIEVRRRDHDTARIAAGHTGRIVAIAHDGRLFAYRPWLGRSLR